MPNTLSVYNPIFYAQEALIQLEKALGMAGRVHRGYDRERQSAEKGQIISIKRPATFAAAAAPSAAQDISAGNVDISLSSWQEVKFGLTDQELAYTGEQIINDHIRPAAYALADKIDLDLCLLYKDIPWFTDAAGSSSILDITNVHQVLFDNAVPMSEPGALHLMVNGIEQNLLQQLAAFNQAQTAGQAGLETLMRGSLGTKFGLEIFANQNVRSHVKGTCNDTALQVLGATAKGATQISLDAVDAGVTGTLVAGDTFVIAGNTQRYAVTALNTAAANVFTNVQITPPLAQAHSDNDAVTVNLDDHTAMLGFHRNAFALAFAPLPTNARELGAKVETATDPVTGLSVRARMFYVGDSSKTFVALDVLYGVKTLDPNLAVRLRG
jgi:hypothetical protein